jgi:hypothetical protein
VRRLTTLLLWVNEAVSKRKAFFTRFSAVTSWKFESCLDFLWDFQWKLLENQQERNRKSIDTWKMLKSCEISVNLRYSKLVVGGKTVREILKLFTNFLFVRKIVSWLSFRPEIFKTSRTVDSLVEVEIGVLDENSMAEVWVSKVLKFPSWTNFCLIKFDYAEKSGSYLCES